MLKTIYLIATIATISQLTGCGENSPQATDFTPTPAVSADELAHLRASYGEKVKKARDSACKSYNTRDSSKISHSYALFIIRLRAAHRNSSSAFNDPLAMHSHVLCALDVEDEKPVFMPNLGTKGGYSISYPADSDELGTVIDGLRAGFVLGHPLVGLMLSSAGHQIMGAFKATGEFSIIDSMGGSLIDVNKLANSLNHAAILNKDGLPITFFGTSISTRLQKSGNDCIRLAALYLRQIIKDNDLDAYQKVNGAFVDDLLQRFEDISLIDNARKISIVEEAIDSRRDQFMASWDHRNHGMHHDRGWRGIKIGDLRPQRCGGREYKSHKYQLWTNFDDALWVSQLNRRCVGGVRFCLAQNERRIPTLSMHFNSLGDLRAEARNVANHRIVQITDLEQTLDRIMDPTHHRLGILYVRDSQEFFAIELDNGFNTL